MTYSSGLLRGIDYLAKGHLNEARAALLTVRNTESPDSSTAARFLAQIDKLERKYVDAISTLKKAAADFGEDEKILAQMAELYMILGEQEQAITAAQKSLQKEPDNPITSLNLAIWQANRSLDPFQVRKSFEQWSQKHLSKLKTSVPELSRQDLDLRQDRALRIGYISGDFSNHAVRYFIEPYLTLHEKSSYEIHVFMTGVADEITEILKESIEHWHDVEHIDDATLLRHIRQIKIDILVDLSGHTEGSKLEIFAARAAPIQVTWWGFVQTLGLQQMDYRLTDSITCPPGSEEFYTEALCRMSCLTAYTQPLNTDDIFPSPWRKNGYVTMVSLNHSRKISDDALIIWRDILLKNPDSGLLIITTETSELGVEHIFEQRFSRIGLPMDRVKAVPRLTMLQFMRLGSIADFALDSFPISGGVTTFHSLWMGLPVLAIRPKQAISIRSYSANTLEHLGLHECIVDNPTELVERASKLITEQTIIDDLRSKTRERLLKSPFMDHQSRVRELEKCFSEMWRRYVCGEPIQSFNSQTLPN